MAITALMLHTWLQSGSSSMFLSFFSISSLSSLVIFGSGGLLKPQTTAQTFLQPVGSEMNHVWKVIYDQPQQQFPCNPESPVTFIKQLYVRYTERVSFLT